jgi:hypothetical protein
MSQQNQWNWRYWTLLSCKFVGLVLLALSVSSYARCVQPNRTVDCFIDFGTARLILGFFGVILVSLYSRRRDQAQKTHVCWGYHAIDTYLGHWLVGCNLETENTSPIVACVYFGRGLALGAPPLLRVGTCLQSRCLEMWIVPTRPWPYHTNIIPIMQSSDI